MRQDEDERDQQNDLAQTGQQQADLGLTQRHKALLAGDLEAHGKDACHVDAHGPCGVVDQRRIRGEDARNSPRRQHHEQPEQAGVAAAQQQLEAECLLDAGLFARAEIEAHYRLTALTDALNGQGAQLGSAGDDGHGTHSHVAAVPRQTGAEADGQQALSGHHHKGGDAQRHHRQDDLLFRAHIVLAQAQDGLFAGEEVQDPHRTHSLTEHGGNSSAPHAQTQTKDQDGVENNVDDRTDDGGKHTGLGKALRGDEGVHAQHQQHKHRAQNVDATVRQRIGHGGVTGTKEPQQGGCPGVEHHGQHHREEQQHGKAVGDDLLCLLLVALSQRNGGAGCAARAHQHGERVQQHKDGGEQSHAGQRCRADAGNMSDVNAVHDVIQQVDHLCNDRRDHELQHQLFYAAGTHILFCLCHGSDSPFTSNLNYPLYYTQNPQKYQPLFAKFSVLRKKAHFSPAAAPGLPPCPLCSALFRAAAAFASKFSAICL